MEEYKAIDFNDFEDEYKNIYGDYDPFEDYDDTRIKTDLIKDYVANKICAQIHDICINADRIADTKAIKMIREIQKVFIKHEGDCSKSVEVEVIDEIVEIFRKNNVSIGAFKDI